jgi:antitoxin component YwqK of YwqJK toxin-antitoxin module
MKFAYFILFLFLVGCSLNENTVNSYDLNVEGNIYKLNGERFSGKVLDATKNGRVKKSFQCLEGKIEGEYLEYYNNGSLKIKYTYNNGLLNGVFENYYENGVLKTKGYFKKGNKLNIDKNGIPFNGRNGEWLFYSKKGFLEKRHLYNTNSDIAEAYTYYTNGKIHFKGTFNKRNIDAETWTEYDEFGKLIDSYP